MSIKERYIAKQRDLSRLSVEPPFPHILKIDTCNACNYRCVFCPQAKEAMSGAKPKGCIDDALCRHIMKDAYDAGAREICLSAMGEPLLNPRLEEYIAFAKNLGYTYVFFNTNGYLMTEERSASILQAGVDSVKFSINAGKENYALVHGIDAFDRVVQNLRAFDKTRKALRPSCALSVSYVATAATRQEADEVERRVRPHVDDFMVMNANNRGGSLTAAERKIFADGDQYSYRYPCSQLFNNVYVTSEGYMLLCCQDFENVTVVADLRKESVADAWHNEKFTAFRKRYLAHDLEGTLCINCLGIQEDADVIPLTPEKAYYCNDETRLADMHQRIEALAGKIPTEDE